jgi:AAA+ superfamily predicted ATPase
MGIEDFIRDALHQPYDYVAYHVARELAELHPGKTILEGTDWEFDLEAFVHDGRCSVVAQKSVFEHTRIDWEGAGKRLRPWTCNAWLNVLWQGELLDVVFITCTEGGYCRRHHWIIAGSSSIAEKFYDAVCEWSCEVRGEILVYENGYFEKNKELFDSIKSATFDNLILGQSLKQQIQDDFKQFFESRETYERYGIPWRRGSLFIGPPGNGKTHTVKALINSLGQPCIYVRGFAGNGSEQENMAEVFKRARMAPCLVVLEDLDAMIHGSNRSFFLNELDGFKPNTGVAVLATTNHPDKLDVAILDRPSRFDRKYYFNLPAQTERLAYIEKWNSELQPELRVSQTTAPLLVNKTEGFSFAYLKELFVSAMVQWMSNDGKSPMDDVILGQVELLRSQMNDKKEEKKETKKNWFARLVTHRVNDDVDADLVSR